MRPIPAKPTEKQAVLNSFQDLSNVLDDLPAALDRINWNSDHSAVASRAAVLGPIMDDLICQFAESFAQLGNVGLDAGNMAAAKLIADVIGDTFADVFVAGWEAQSEKAAEARREGHRFAELEDNAAWARSAPEAA